MDESITTEFSRDNQLEQNLVIEEGFTNDNGEPCILLSIGKWSDFRGGSDGENFLLNKQELNEFIEKLNFYHSRIGGE